jgi:hypothetical protein
MVNVKVNSRPVIKNKKYERNRKHKNQNQGDYKQNDNENASYKFKDLSGNLLLILLWFA